VYDRHEYVTEKRDALQKLAVLVERILNPADNVVQIPASGTTNRVLNRPFSTGW